MNKLQLLMQLARREVESRYKGSVIGIFWSILTPIAMLAIYTFVFSVVFKSHWAEGAGGAHSFASIIFSGLITFGIFAEVATRSPTLIVSQQNLVKKVVFPLPLLPAVALVSALFQAFIAFVILLTFQVAVGSGLPVSTLALPLLLVPLCALTLGIGWFFAALGVYLRDMSQVIPTIVTALMFLSPIFYPSTNLPDWLRPFSQYNPLGYSVETVRDAIVFGGLPVLQIWIVELLATLLIAFLGYVFFAKTRKGFADVL